MQYINSLKVQLHPKTGARQLENIFYSMSTEGVEASSERFIPEQPRPWQQLLQLTWLHSSLWLDELEVQRRPPQPSNATSQPYCTRRNKLTVKS